MTNQKLLVWPWWPPTSTAGCSPLIDWLAMCLTNNISSPLTHTFDNHSALLVTTIAYLASEWPPNFMKWLVKWCYTRTFVLAYPIPYSDPYLLFIVYWISIGYAPEWRSLHNLYHRGPQVWGSVETEPRCVHVTDLYHGLGAYAIATYRNTIQDLAYWGRLPPSSGSATAWCVIYPERQP